MQISDSTNTLDRRRLLKMAFWEMDIDTEALIEVLDGVADGAETVQREQLFVRLLTSFDWYTILKLIPPEVLGQALSDEVLERVWPLDLRQRLRYARSVLHS